MTTPANPPMRGPILFFGAGLTDDHRKQVAAWVAANGVDPAVVPVDATFTWSETQLTMDVFVRDAEGHMMIDPTEPNRLLREKRTVPLRAPWPGFRKATRRDLG